MKRLALQAISAWVTRGENDIENIIMTDTTVTFNAWHPADIA
jgi:hypothetical protein